MSWKDEYKTETDYEDEKSDFEPLPEGVYHATITDAAFSVGGDYGDQVKLEYTVTDGDFSKRKVWANYRMEDKNSRKYFKIAMSRLAFDRETINDPTKLTGMLETCLSTPIELFVKQTVSKTNGKTYNNAYINSRTDEGNGSPVLTNEAGDDLPF